MSFRPHEAGADVDAADADVGRTAGQAAVDIAEARRALHAEAARLLAMAETVGADDRFLKAVGLMQDCRSRIVVTGHGQERARRA